MPGAHQPDSKVLDVVSFALIAMGMIPLSIMPFAISSAKFLVVVLGVIMGSALCLVLDEYNIDNMIFRACHVYAVRSAIDLRHHENRRTGSDAAKKLICNGHRTAAMYSKSLLQRYRSIWA